MDNSSVLI